MSFPCQGRIVWAAFPDSTGGGAGKKRPAVIVTADADIVPGGTVFAVGVSRQSWDAATDVPLAWQAQGRCRSMLRTPSYAVPGWLVALDLSAIDPADYGGVVMPTESAMILARVDPAGRSAPPPPAASTPPSPPATPP